LIYVEGIREGGWIMKYEKPRVNTHSIYDVQEYEALAGTVSCTNNTGVVCGVNICICVAFCFKKR
jgi:hypothetical protein